MSAPPLPAGEADRLAELWSLGILDTAPEQAYDDITLLASQICETPIAMVTFVDDDRQWFKSTVGVDIDQTGRDISLCAHAVLAPDRMLTVNDAALDERFASNPLVTGAGLRFYAGVPLTTRSGNALGTLCVIDREPTELTADQEAALHALSRQVMAQLELRRAVAALEAAATERRAYQRQLEEHLARATADSITDPLTGLANRRAFDARLAEEITRAQRYGSALSLAMIDVDHFKRINDACGHPAGDAALVHIAQVLRSQSRSIDLVARFGGEEFAVILPETDLAGATALSERFRRTIQRTFAGECGELTVSIGVAALSGSDGDELVGAADVALYRAKGAGRNCVLT